MSDPSYPAFPVLSFLGFVLVLVPLPWHFQAWNSGTCLYMIWTAIASLNLFINSIVWRANVLNVAPVWCDISTRIIIASAVAIPASSLCINRRLYNIASIQTVSITRAEKRRAVMIDLCIGIGLPLLEIVLAYIVTGHRFDIYEGIGCQPAIYLTPVTFPLVLCWPIAIGLISAVYCVLTLRAFMKRRAQFNQYLACQTSLTMSRYFRLMALATVELLCTIPISAYGIYLNVSDGGVSPWISWSNVHYNYSRVGQYPAVIWRSDHQAVVSFELSRWLLPFCAFVFFLFFGFASEARRHYQKAYLFIRKRLRLCSRVDRRPVGRKVRTKLDSEMTSTSSLTVFSPGTPPPPFSRYSDELSRESLPKGSQSVLAETPICKKSFSHTSEPPEMPLGLSKSEVQGDLAV